jgi:hypothetical protein
MGFLKRARKRLGKFAKKAAVGALKLAVSQVPGVGGPVAQVLASKMRSRGVARNKVAMVNKALDTKRAALAHRADGGLLKTASQGGPSEKATALRPAGALAVKAATLPALAASGYPTVKRLFEATPSGAAAGKKAHVSRRLAKAGDVDKTIRTLTPGQKQLLADDFKRSGGGTPAQFREFLAANL